MKEDYPAFDMEYKWTTKKYADANTIVPQVTLPKNMFNVSCIPWLHYKHFLQTPIMRMIKLLRCLHWKNMLN